MRLIINLYNMFDKTRIDIPLIAKRQCIYIPIPIPTETLMPSILPYKATCLITTAVSGPGLVNATKCAIADQINIS